jgi:hypothetical protein
MGGSIVSKIAVCVPTWRPELYEKTFIPAWSELFEKHDVHLLTSIDNEKLDGITLRSSELEYPITINRVMGKNTDLVYQRNAGTKLLSFAYIAKYLPEVEYIICLDDDVTPVGDPIQDHIDALNKRVPISWMPIADIPTRGLPYGVRDEAEVVLSHGVWTTTPDIDAPQQLILGDKPAVNYYKMAIPKGVLYPMSEMNIAFKRKALPYMYFAPTTRDVYGADDIFCGIESKRAFDELGWAVVTGYATVDHKRASNVFKILDKQGKFLMYNEVYYKGDTSGDEEYFKIYKEKRLRWEQWMKELL